VEDLEEAKEIVELDEDDVNEEVGISEEEEEIIEDKEDVVERVKRILDEAEGDIEDFDDEIHQIHEEELEEMNEEEQEEEEKEEIIDEGKEGVSQVDDEKIFNWKDAIDDYQENIKKKLGTAKQRKQWQEAIEYYEELIAEMEGQKMDIGGVVQHFGSPMIEQGMQGSLSGFGTSSTAMTF
jgi:maltooligosyltrehalose synthase